MSNTETNTVTRHRRIDCSKHVDGLAIQTTAYCTNETHGSIEHCRSDTNGDYVNVYIHANKGDRYEPDDAEVPTVSAVYLEGGQVVVVKVGWNVSAFISVEQAQALAESLEKALDDSTLGET